MLDAARPLAWSALVAVGVVVVPELRWRRWRWEVRDRRSTCATARCVTRTLVPMLRVQHVDTTQGRARAGARARHRRRPHRGRATTASPRSTRATRAGCATASPSSRAPPMSSEPELRGPEVALGPPRRLHPAGIAVLALATLRNSRWFWNRMNRCARRAEPFMPAWSH